MTARPIESARDGGAPGSGADRAGAASGSPGALLLVVSGPSGVGKSTIAKEIRSRTPGAVLSVSCTTRPRLPGETDGADYHFITEEAFERMTRDPSGPPGLGAFLEHAGVYGKRYGTPRDPVEEGLRQGRLVILEIDVQGARQVRARAPDSYGVFVLPPSEEALLARLRARGRDTEEAVQKRFAAAKREIEEARQGGVYDLFLVNDDLESAVKRALEAVGARRALGRRA